MPYERIYASHSDPTWSVPHPTGPTPGGDPIPPRESMPGAIIQWRPGTAVGIATGDLSIDGANEPDLPTLDLRDFLPEPHDSDTAARHQRLAEAISQCIDTAYQIGVATPRFVWFSRDNINQMIRNERRARNTAFGADE